MVRERGGAWLVAAAATRNALPASALVYEKAVSNRQFIAREAITALKFSAVSLAGLAVDAVLLHVGLEVGIPPAWARVFSLAGAMQLTFVVNGLHVFGALDRKRLVRQWASYMAASGLGNFCNYWVFVTMVSTHWSVVSSPYVALTAGAICAWIINYSGIRFLVFRKVRALTHHEAGDARASEDTRAPSRG